MKLEQAIETALDGNALLFAGAGCSSGATNLKDEPFRNGMELAAFLSEKCSLSNNTSLEDASETFADMFGIDALIEEMQKEFTVKGIAQHHKVLAMVPWKRIYTTNYDNVIEAAYGSTSQRLNPITLSDKIHELSKYGTLCVHLNGFVDKLNRSTVWKEFKLTDSSYLTASLAESEWSVIFRQDIQLARAVFFVGYSLYDLDIKRILFETPSLREKCIFIIGSNPDQSTIRRAEKFGKAIQISVMELSEKINNIKHTYSPIKQDEISLLSIKEQKEISRSVRITDRAFIDMFLLGDYREGMISKSLRYGDKYFLERKNAVDRIFDFVDKKYNVITVCSELGNGKSLFLKGLVYRAIEQGYRVFEVCEHDDETIKELDKIAKLHTKVLVIIEEYQGWMSEIRLFRSNCSDQAILLLTARNAVHDVVIDELASVAKVDSVPEINLDKLDDEEINWFVDVFNEYGLWGEYAAYGRNRKNRFLRESCSGQIHAILLKLLDSPDICGRFRSLYEKLKIHRDYKEVILSIFVLKVLNQSCSVDTLIDIWGELILEDINFKKNNIIRQLVDFNRYQIIVRSSIAAEYILRRIYDASTTVTVLTRIATRVNELVQISKRYRSLFNSLMRFSSLQLILPEEGRNTAVLRYFESIKKLQGCKYNPLFWLQYAIACTTIDELFRARKYFETAYALAKDRNWDPRQIDNHYARYLLKEAVEMNDYKLAINNFKQAQVIIDRQMRNERVHYPYSVAILYWDFFNRYSNDLSKNQINLIEKAMTSVVSRIGQLPESRRRHRYVRDCKRAMGYITDRIKEISEKNGSDKKSID